MYKVAVMMSTYNGEKYLGEQIDSIFAQKDVEVMLYVRDDGSTDRTIDIIKTYQSKYRNIHFSIGKNVGVGNSFMQLVYDIPIDFDFYAFADQDDVWLPQKLIMAIKEISTKTNPVLYCSNQTLVDKNLNYIGMRYSQAPDTSYLQILSKNTITGCTMVWNNALNDYLTDINKRPSQALLQNRIHDVWVAMVACVVGEIVFDMNSYIEYRQHENNVVGGKKKNKIDGFKEKISKIKNPNKRNGRSKLAKEIYSKYEEHICDQTILVFSALYNKSKLIENAKILKDYSDETTIGLFLKILLGLY